MTSHEETLGELDELARALQRAAADIPFDLEAPSKLLYPRYVPHGTGYVRKKKPWYVRVWERINHPRTFHADHWMVQGPDYQPTMIPRTMESYRDG